MPEPSRSQNTNGVPSAPTMRCRCRKKRTTSRWSSVAVASAKLFMAEPRPGGPDEHVFQRGLAHGHRLDRAGKRLDQLGDELVAVGKLEADQAVEHLGAGAEAARDLLGQPAGVAAL